MWKLGRWKNGTATAGQTVIAPGRPFLVLFGRSSCLVVNSPLPHPTPSQQNPLPSARRLPAGALAQFRPQAFEGGRHVVGIEVDLDEARAIGVLAGGLQGGAELGDGAGAVVLRASEEPGILAGKLHSDGQHHALLRVDGSVRDGVVQGDPFIRMEGQAVFKFAVTVLHRVVDEVLKMSGLKDTDIDWLVPHQANIRIIEATAKKLGMSMDKVVVTVENHGNTSSASIPLALDAAVRDGRIKAGQTVLLEAIGGGFTWGAVLLKW